MATATRVDNGRSIVVDLTHGDADLIVRTLRSYATETRRFADAAQERGAKVDDVLVRGLVESATRYEHLADLLDEADTVIWPA